MDAIERYLHFKDYPLDAILLKIKNGDIKAGKYSDLVKVKNSDKIMKAKVLFSNGQKDQDKQE